MPRIKSRQNVDTCGDCGATDAVWASINKGILLCTECCSVHRSLGRQISQVKHLSKSQWTGFQLQMLQALNNNGANNVWEHLLLENNSKLMKKKPGPKDPLATKAEFIKQKHEQMLYAFRDVYENGNAEIELGKQLHASCRTPNLESSFRLLASGADPNYFHDEKGNTPLHVAIKNEQKLQIELLLVYGADPSYPDAKGQTCFELSKVMANKEAYRRLEDNLYEVTDTFSQYLCMKKPDHINQHYLIPQIDTKSNPTSLAKLQKLGDGIFEELVMDVFDEVDRRNAEAVWSSCADTTELSQIPFLPVDPTLSSTKNQGRQKLARFTTPDFKALVYDILKDAERRMYKNNGRGFPPHLREYSQAVDEDPLYDSVASDDDYEMVPEEEDENDSASVNNRAKDLTSLEMENMKKRKQIVAQLTDQLRVSDNTITDLKAEVAQLRHCMKTLQTENFELKSQLSLQNKQSGDTGDGLDAMLHQKTNTELAERFKRPTSMYETREFLQRPNKRTLDMDLRGSVMQRTELVTKSIQLLCRSIEEPEKQQCTTMAHNIRQAVGKLSTAVPKEDSVKLMPELLDRLESECVALQEAKLRDDRPALDAHYKRIRELAFYLAKHTKDIVTKYSSG